MMQPDITPQQVSTGDIVQVTDRGHLWFGCLIIVSEVKPWGIQGFAPVPRNDGSPMGEAYTRLDYTTFERCGKAISVPHNMEPE